MCFFFRDDENIRNRFGPIDIGYSIFSSTQLSQEEEEVESEDILATVISQGINFFKYIRKIQ